MLGIALTDIIVFWHFNEQELYINIPGKLTVTYYFSILKDLKKIRYYRIPNYISTEMPIIFV